MPAGHDTQTEGRSQTLAKVAAFVCCTIAVGLLIASVLYPSAARAGQQTAKPAPTLTFLAMTRF
jgi:hypothetical protein